MVKTEQSAAQEAADVCIAEFGASVEKFKASLVGEDMTKDYVTAILRIADSAKTLSLSMALALNPDPTREVFVFMAGVRAAAEFNASPEAKQ